MSVAQVQRIVREMHEIPFEVHIKELEKVFPRMVVPANYFRASSW